MHLGFLLCDHFTPDEQAKEMWHLINPKLADTVSKDQVKLFLTDLAYIAVDLNICKCCVTHNYLSFITIQLESF